MTYTDWYNWSHFVEDVSVWAMGNVTQSLSSRNLNLQLHNQQLSKLLHSVGRPSKTYKLKKKDKQTNKPRNKSEYLSFFMIQMSHVIILNQWPAKDHKRTGILKVWIMKNTINVYYLVAGVYREGKGEGKAIWLQGYMIWKMFRTILCQGHSHHSRSRASSWIWFHTSLGIGLTWNTFNGVKTPLSLKQ